MRASGKVNHMDARRSLPVVGVVSIALLTGCMSSPPAPKIIPSLEYSRRLQSSQQGGAAPFKSPKSVAARNQSLHNPEATSAGSERIPEVRFVDGSWEPRDSGAGSRRERSPIVSNEIPGAPADEAAYSEYRASMSDSAPYTGPLTIGEPGVTASLWGESRAETDMFRDHRAFQPMDLITIVVSENAEGEKEADTETKSSSSLAASIENFLGLEKYLTQANKNIELDSLIKAETQNDFKGEGSTSRKDSLVARISAMVVEVLPSGILRIEGEKIIAVNNEEQVMVISGLVRTRDINSENEVSSAKIANMRIDYYGKGIVAEGQYGGWLGRALRILWPF